MMAHNSDVLIAQLVGTLEPVRPLRMAHGMGYTLVAAAISAALVIGLFGLSPALQAGQFAPIPTLANGLFLGLGLACSFTVVSMSRPCVGASRNGWTWAAAMAALLPAAGLAAALGNTKALLSPESIGHGAECFIIGGGASLIVLGTLVLWLRKGAPSAPDRAGLVAGIAAGSLGIFAFGLHCPQGDIVHLGVWHSAAVLAMGALGRAAVPALVRW